MSNNLKQFEHEADENIIKAKKNKSISPSTQSLINNTNPHKVINIELNMEKYTKMYELNEDGLRLFGQYKKEKLFKTLKWSFSGTVIGYTLALLGGVAMKKWDRTKRDCIQASILIGTMIFTSWVGFKVSDAEFALRTNKLIDIHGKELK